MKKTGGVKGVMLLAVRIEAVTPLFAHVSGVLLTWVMIFLYLTWICIVLVASHIVSHFRHVSKCAAEIL